MRRTFVLLLFVAATAAAQPVITSVTPSTGKVTGGETVTIRGSGFVSTADVRFNTTAARNVVLVDAATLRVTTPPLLPGIYDVKVWQGGGEPATLPRAYSVTGEVSDGFETILIPIYSPTTRGAYGAIFESAVVAATKSEQPVDVYGATNGACGIDGGKVPEPEFMTVSGNGELGFVTECSPATSRLLYVRRDDAPFVTFNDRVTDITRTSSSLGTEIPIVRSNKMTSGRMVLANVPIDGRYRLMLRIYALRPTVAFVTTVGEPRTVLLQPGNSIFEPAYAQFIDFPVPVDPGSQSTIRVVIDQPQDIVAGPPMWAFITVTNNETQQITTITPD